MDNDRDVLITNVEYDRLPESHSIIERAESQSVRSLDTETNQLSEEIDPRESQTNSGNNSSSDSKMKLQDLRRKVWTFRTYYAASMWISFCAYGAAFTIFFPTWYDLTHLLGSTDEAMGWAKTLTSFMYCAGTLSMGFIHNYASRDVLLLGQLVVMALVTIALPHTGSYVLFMVGIILVSFVFGGADLAINVTAFNMFPPCMTGPVLQSLHLFWSIGAGISQAWSEPFINPNATVEVSNPDQPDVTTTTTPPPEPGTYKTDIWIPYMLTGLFLLASAANNLIAVLLRIRKERQLRVHLKDDQNNHVTKPTDCKLIDQSHENVVKEYRSVGWRNFGVLLAALALSFESGLEFCTLGYMVQFLMGIGYHQDAAAQINTAGSLAFIAGRGITMLITIFVCHIRYVLILSIGLIVAGLTIIVTLASDTADGWTWVGVLLLAGGMGPNFPGIYSVLNDKISVTDGIGGVLMGCSGLVMGLTPILVSYTIASHPIYVMYLGYACIAIITTSLLLLHFFEFEIRPNDQLADGVQKSKTTATNLR